MPAVYDELRKLARTLYGAREGRANSSGDGAGQRSLSAPDEGKSAVWQNRAHFCAIAAGCDEGNSGGKGAGACGAETGRIAVRVSLSGVRAPGKDASIDMIALHERWSVCLNGSAARPCRGASLFWRAYGRRSGGIWFVPGYHQAGLEHGEGMAEARNGENG